MDMDKKEMLELSKQYIDELALRYEEARKRRELAEEARKEANKEYEEAERALFAAMDAADLDGITRDGYKYSRRVRTFYSPRAGNDEIIGLFKRHGLGGLVKETVNRQTLNAALADLETEYGELPPWAQDAFSAYDKETISRRKI
jgi:hypothetical protein